MRGSRKSTVGLGLRGKNDRHAYRDAAIFARSRITAFHCYVRYDRLGIALDLTGLARSGIDATRLFPHNISANRVLVQMRPGKPPSRQDPAFHRDGSERIRWAASQAWWGDVHAQLRDLAAILLNRERAGHTLQPTALLNEAYLRLANQRNRWNGKLEFFASVASTLRHVLVDHARRKNAVKRIPLDRRVTLDINDIAKLPDQLDLMDLDEALNELDEIDPALTQIVEIRFFGGLTEQEAAEVLGVSLRTVQLRWRAARAWLRQALEPPV